jgi:hypothetical protein
MSSSSLRTALNDCGSGRYLSTGSSLGDESEGADASRVSMDVWTGSTDSSSSSYALLCAFQ